MAVVNLGIPGGTVIYGDGTNGYEEIIPTFGIQVFGPHGDNGGCDQNVACPPQ